MAKKSKSSQFPQNRSQSTKPKFVPPVTSSQRVQPEQMSLNAHSHIQLYLQTAQKPYLEQEDLNAILRLSQHLRIFGLLSAVGYINQSNDQNGKVRNRTVPIWQCLLGELIAPGERLSKQDLREKIVKMTRQNPPEYMAMWRRSLILAPHWNFWARAYAQT
ncbi:MAG: hypothetical protein D6756_04445 [Cyanobacteria bacterium J083]|nr:MAG: hypothetical protein D6756_04445 [Cyanobacteria bacterium J083]